MLRRSGTMAKNIISKDLEKMELQTDVKNQSNPLTKERLQEVCNIRRISKDSNQSEDDVKCLKDIKEKPDDTSESSVTKTSAVEVEVNHDSDSDSSKYRCPICSVILSTSHDFTVHIRSHNTNENEQDYTCKICFKMLSSNSSLDRHILVHSGERPFRCRVCAVTFNTNGNMHRHMRTHDSTRTDSCESDASTDSNNDGQNRLCLENNNNRVSTKRKYGQEENDSSSTKTKRRYKTSECIYISTCPVCDKEDFPTRFLLEQHVELEHPEHEIECGKCDMNFKNFHALHLHRFMKHKDTTERVDDKTKNKTVLGFSDLTFVDFSAEKFPQIARAACELNVHMPSNGNAGFECSRCSLAFPCSSALEMHDKSCKTLSVPSMTEVNKNFSAEDIKREDFFATLNLQNKSAQVKMPDKNINENQVETGHSDDIKDLADIPSIIHMASAKALLKQLSSKPQDVVQETTKENQGEEEAQDLFSAEFRKMKLRGEFPCRLCTAIFPNLRALKGHNRLHLTGNGPGPYRCNMCPHSSTDKAALIRHMRTHNGDRPYECAICNYAFTTKANCERHLRNRHAKVTRDEVKRSIIYHPSEDPNNDDIKREQQSSHVQSALPPSSVFGTPETDPESAAELIPSDRSTPVSHLTTQRSTLNFTLPRDLSIVIPHCNLATRILEATQQAENQPVQKIQVKSLEQLSRFPQYMESEVDSEEDEYRPIDLSMDALDLSKKAKPEEKPTPVTPVASEPHDLSKNGFDFISEQTATAMLQIAQQQQRLKGNAGPAANFYAAQLQQWYRGGFPLPPSPFNPFFLPATSSHPFLTPPNNAQDITSMKELEKEIIRGLQLSGGSLIMNNMALASERLQAFQQRAFNMAVAAKGDASPLSEDLKNPLVINTNLPTTIETTSPYSPNHNSPVNKTAEPSTPTSHSPGAVKMVIKNGVLMPKQKQRRYRTERPFSCEHCSARFTLRSNMERHVKQQHPQHWAQRQRASGHVVRRGPVAHQQMPFNQTETENQPHGFNISEHVKYAILAQQLQRSEIQSPNQEMEEDDVELVIDEDVPEEKPVIKEECSALENNAKARKVADEILQQAKIMEIASTGIKEKDFDLKIMSNLIPKSPMDFSRPASFIPVATVKHNAISLDGKLAQALSKNTTDKHPVETNQDSVKSIKTEEVDLASVSRLLDNANSQLPFGHFFRNEQSSVAEDSEGEEEGLVASGSASEGNNSGSDENRSESEQRTSGEKKKSAYSLAPNRVSCNYCHRKFPWSSSLRRHILTHTGQKPYKCAHCPLLFTTKSNCDRHLLRKHGHMAQQTSNAIAIPDNTNNAREDVNNMGFITRNVPERPFKCSSCPSSTFSTINNLKKHMSCKHSNTSSSTEQLSGCSRPNSPSSESAEQISDKKEKITDWEAQIGSKGSINENPHPSNVQNSDFPFKCHLCDGSYPDRQVALDHIKGSHREEYELLVSKGAMDAEQDMQTTNHQYEENDETNCEPVKGRFPDYANRKVMCAFCMRRFWSAEDLRRHMRTHSGVRPFQCDICRRRFTLKHSMLRHRKKHDAQARHSLRLRSADGACESSVQAGDSVSETSDEEAKATANRPDGDLIGNLLGISDRGILNKVLISSAHEAAKLLGVEHRK